MTINNFILKPILVKVLHIIGKLSIGGAETMLINTIPYFNTNGVKIEILTLDGEESFLTNKAREEKYPIFSLGNNCYDLSNIYRLYSFLKENKYDLIHVHLFPSLYFTAFYKILFRSKIPLVYTEYNTLNKRREFFLLKPIELVVYSAYSKIICISDDTKKQLEKWVGKKSFKDKLCIINNGIPLLDTSMIDCYSKSMFSISEDTSVLMMVGRFSASKDQKTVIRALSHLTHQKIHLFFIGEGPLLQENIALVEELGLENQVTFLGKRSDVLSLISFSDICILSSNWEGFGLSAVEYMLMGKPSIVSDIEGVREIIGDAGLLFERGSETHLAEKIKELLDNKILVSQLSTVGLERAKLFNIDLMVQSYIRVYKSILKNYEA